MSYPEITPEPELSKPTQNPVTGRLIFALSVIVGLAFLPTLRAGFVNWDDTSHIIENGQVSLHSAANLSNIFRTTVNKTYIPLTILSFNFENLLVGFHPFLYHLDNLLLHILIAILVFFLGRKIGLSDWACFFAGLLFGIHPMRVETVAWITERKGVLYSCFYLLTCHAYWNYLKNSSSKNYFLALGCGLLSVLAKPMAVSLPWILWLFDGLAGRSFKGKSIWLDKIPFFLLIVPFAWITYTLNVHQLHITFPNVFLIFIWTFSFYLIKFLFPHPLAIIYVLPQPIAWDNPQYWPAIATFLSFMTFLFIFRRNKLFVFASLFYCGSTFFLWRYDTGDINTVADRFMYLPSLGFCFLIGHFIDMFLQNSRKLSIKDYSSAVTLCGFLALLLFLKTFSQSSLWTDGNALWQRTLASAPNSPLILTSTGNSLAKDGHFTKALEFYDRALAAAPEYAEAYDKRGVIYDEIENNSEKAIKEFEEAIRLDPKLAMAYYHKANTLVRLQDTDEGMSLYNTAIRLNPGLAEAYINRANLFTRIEKNYDAALRDLNQAIAIDPSFSEAYLSRGNIFWHIKNQSQIALEDFRRALQLDPESEEAREKITELEGEYETPPADTPRYIESPMRFEKPAQSVSDPQ